MSNPKAQILASGRLAWPTAASRLLLPLMLTADTAVIARAGAEEVAAYGLGVSLQLMAQFVAIGAMQGVVTMIAQARGAGRAGEAGRIWAAAQLIALPAGLLMMIGAFFLKPAFLALGADPALAAHAEGAAIGFGLGQMGMMGFIVTTYALDSLGRPGIGLVIVLCANALNLGLDLVFAQGEGAAAIAAGTTSAVRWVMFLAATAALLRLAKARGFTLFPAWRQVRGALSGLSAMGGPFAATYLFQVGAPGAITPAAAGFGVTSVAALQAVMSFSGLAAMAAAGVGVAGVIGVGAAIGRADRQEARRAALAVALAGAPLILAPALIFLAFPHALAAALFPPGEERALTAALFLWAALYVIGNGLCFVTASALRGLGDSWGGLRAVLIAYLALGAPLAGLLGWGLDWGASGLMAALCLSVFAAAGLMARRFARLTR